MPRPEQPSYEELAARNAELAAVVAEQAALIESLRAKVAALRRQAGRDSSTFSQPPSQDSPAAEAKARARGRRARPGRAQGGQKGHPGASLAWSASPDETVVIAPGSCGWCGADLTGGAGRVASRVQVLGAAGNRTKAAITGFGILDGYAGVLVRDYGGGYLSYDAGLAGVRQCLAHLYRYLDDAYAIDPVSQVWTRQASDALRAAGAAVRAARADGQASLNPDLLAGLRHSYDQAVAFGISVNLSRPWHPFLPGHRTQPRPPPPGRHPRRPHRQRLDATAPGMIN